MKNLIKISIVIFLIIVIVVVVDFLRHAGNTSNLQEQLAKMDPAERTFCKTVLSKITSTSSEKEVIALLGKPSRDLILKKNWWVQLGNRKDRIGVYFSTSGYAKEVVLDGGIGRFYYRYKLPPKNNNEEQILNKSLNTE